MIDKVLKNDRYVLKDVEGFQQARTPYVGVWAIANIRPWIGERDRVQDKDRNQEI